MNAGFGKFLSVKIPWPARVVSRRAKNSNWKRLGQDFLTLKLRPIHATGNAYDCQTPLEEEARTAIVIQGPIMREFEFTFDTIRRYRKMFPEATIILSTWDSEKDLEKFGKFCKVLTSRKSDVPRGPGNDNLQMMTANVGVSYAKQMGAEFVLKTRADQRIYDSFSLRALMTTLMAFPPSPDSLQKFRIITLSFNTFLYRTYGLSDMLTFGHIEDVLSYWNGEMEVSAQKPDVNSKTAFEPGKYGIGEVRFCSRFLESHGETLAWTTEHYWNMLRDRFVIIDATSLDLFWPKYSALEDRWGSRTDHLEQISFSKWLSILLDRLAIRDDTLGQL